MRYWVYGLCVVLALLCVLSGLSIGRGFFWPLVVLLPLVALGSWDLLQPRHNILRLYPLVGHFRWLFEAVRPQIHQYLVEGDTEGRPFDRNERSLVYERAKNVVDAQPFGTELDVYGDGYEWLNHSIAPRPKAAEPFRIDIGGPQCERPYSASVLNISAMSFGALSGNAIQALNQGARLGDFAHDTGEGGISHYHREPGGDLIWEIGSGYFGCRDDRGRFDPDRFAEQAGLPQVRMIEVKLSQGAKPGHGGMLPGAKVTAEIAEARRIPVGRDCISPGYHSAFDTPLEFMDYLARLRELSGGKPVGFKLCVGHAWEFLAIGKAMLESGIQPDFIVVDGAEGGTGAAPPEFSDRIGLPLREGLLFVHNALVGIGLREQIRVGASGKLVSGFRLAASLALGADWCNTARGFMFSLGCVQSQRCHLGTCPTGVATQDPQRMRAIVVTDKAQRVRQFHRHTVGALAEVVAAVGLNHPSELRPRHLCRRVGENAYRSCDRIYRFLAPGELLEGTREPMLRRAWDLARPDRFQPMH